MLKKEEKIVRNAEGGGRKRERGREEGRNGGKFEVRRKTRGKRARREVCTVKKRR